MVVLTRKLSAGAIDVMCHPPHTDCVVVCLMQVSKLYHLQSIWVVFSHVLIKALEIHKVFCGWILPQG